YVPNISKPYRGGLYRGCHMQRYSFGLPVNIIVLIFATVILTAGCVGVTHLPYYESPAEQSSAQMVPVKNEEMKFDFLIPQGWVSVSGDEALPDILKVPRDNATETGMGVWRKGDRGSLLVWCETTDQNPYLIEQSLYRISPSGKAVKGPLQIQSSGWNPEFWRYDSSIVEKGQKRGFSFFMGLKSQQLTSVSGCNYAVIGRSATLEDSGEIENDFIAILKSLKN
ncbi:hypothetical protein MUP29_08120, partial [bacterium]|nr:hypothetical protein [bacterium]